MADEKEQGRDGVRESLRQGLGLLGAFKEAIEETINEARERGDLSPERAKEMIRGAVRRAQDAADHAFERVDFARRREIDELRTEVSELRQRVLALEGRLGGTPTGDAASSSAAGEGAGSGQAEV